MSISKVVYIFREIDVGLFSYLSELGEVVVGCYKESTNVFFFYFIVVVLMSFL